MKLFIEDLDVQGKRVLLRVDFNVPLDGDGNILDASRIEASVATIQYILDKGGSIVLMSHMGRPLNCFEPELTLAPCAKHLSGLLNKNVVLAPDVIGERVQEMVKHLKIGEILMLENLRFHRGEIHPDEDRSFAKELASYGDLYVNDAFACSHRKHTSVYTLPLLFPLKAAAGYLLEKEMKMLSEMLLSPQRPFYALIGGAKISTKIGVLHSLVQKVDGLLIGGGLAYTFLKAKGIGIGKSLVDESALQKAKEIIDIAKNRGIPLLLPIDIIAAKSMSSIASSHTLEIANGIPDEFMGVDIGPKTLELFKGALKNAKTILWNGPLGIYEIEKFASGTKALAGYIASLGVTTVIGGGDSISAINKLDLEDKITFISTGGGATLEYIQDGTLPGIEALSEKVATPRN